MLCTNVSGSIILPFDRARSVVLFLDNTAGTQSLSAVVLTHGYGGNTADVGSTQPLFNTSAATLISMLPHGGYDNRWIIAMRDGSSRYIFVVTLNETTGAVTAGSKANIGTPQGGYTGLSICDWSLPGEEDYIGVSWDNTSDGSSCHVALYQAFSTTMLQRGAPYTLSNAYPTSNLELAGTKGGEIVGICKAGSQGFGNARLSRVGQTISEEAYNNYGADSNTSDTTFMYTKYKTRFDPVNGRVHILRQQHAQGESRYSLFSGGYSAWTESSSVVLDLQVWDPDTGNITAVSHDAAAGFSYGNSDPKVTAGTFGFFNEYIFGCWTDTAFPTNWMTRAAIGNAGTGGGVESSAASFGLLVDLQAIDEIRALILKKDNNGVAACIATLT